MKRISLAVAAIALLVTAPAALAGSNRADTYYTFVCVDPEGNLVTAESVDAHAIEQGGKLMGSAHWAAEHPEYDCDVEGPFHN